jgi:hypothetical protein
MTNETEKLIYALAVIWIAFVVAMLCDWFA